MLIALNSTIMYEDSAPTHANRDCVLIALNITIMYEDSALAFTLTNLLMNNNNICYFYLTCQTINYN